MADTLVTEALNKAQKKINKTNQDTKGGVLLIIATIIALVIANTGWGEPYHHLLKEKFTFGPINGFNLTLSIHHWINDGLMVIFFVVAGLEIKREVMVGELSTKEKAAMPLLAAIGGMVVPALIFIIFNLGEKSSSGWAIPMATDIAYALGIMGLLSKRVPVQLKTFLIALAIADDIGAILIIAMFYSKSIVWALLGAAALLYALMFVLNLRGVKSLLPYLLIGFVFWICFLYSGVHATIAGVLFALVIPVKPRYSSEQFHERLKNHRQKYDKANFNKLNPIAHKEQDELLSSVKKDVKKSQSPLITLEHALSGFNAYLVIPIFALANAGVKLDIGLAELFSKPLGLGIILGLLVGKVLGIFFFSYLGSKIGLASLSEQLNWRHILGIGFIAGIGFTMSLFITNLAFTDAQEMVKLAKISILLASFLAGVTGTIILIRKRKPEKSKDDTAKDDSKGSL